MRASFAVLICYQQPFGCHLHVLVELRWRALSTIQQWAISTVHGSTLVSAPDACTIGQACLLQRIVTPNSQHLFGSSASRRSPVLHDFEESGRMIVCSSQTQRGQNPLSRHSASNISTPLQRHSANDGINGLSHDSVHPGRLHVFRVLRFPSHHFVQSILRGQCR